jgi:hypothetical protein
MVANTKVTTFAIATGYEPIKKPYIIHAITPISKTEYMSSDKSFVCFVLITFKACGKKEKVVQMAANVPISSVQFMV